METSWQLQVEEGKGDVHGRERRLTSEEQSQMALDDLLPIPEPIPVLRSLAAFSRPFSEQSASE